MKQIHSLQLFISGHDEWNISTFVLNLRLRFNKLRVFTKPETKAQITAGCIMTSIQPFGASGGEKQESPPACPLAPPDLPEV